MKMGHNFKGIVKHAMIYFVGLPVLLGLTLWMAATKNVAILVAGIIIGIGIGSLIEGIRKGKDNDRN